MKFCTNCGAKLEDEMKFCVSCGFKAAVTQTAPAAEAVQPIPVEPAPVVAPQPIPVAPAAPVTPQPAPTYYTAPAPTYEPAPLGKAIAGLVLVELAAVCCWIPIVGVVLAIVGLVLCSKSAKVAKNNILEGDTSGKTKAVKILGTIGKILGIIMLICCVIIGTVALIELILIAAGEISMGDFPVDDIFAIQM